MGHCYSLKHWISSKTNLISFDESCTIFHSIMLQLHHIKRHWSRHKQLCHCLPRWVGPLLRTIPQPPGSKTLWCNRAVGALSFQWLFKSTDPVLQTGARYTKLGHSNSQYLSWYHRHGFFHLDRKLLLHSQHTPHDRQCHNRPPKVHGLVPSFHPNRPPNHHLRIEHIKWESSHYQTFRVKVVSCLHEKTAFRIGAKPGVLNLFDSGFPEARY